MDQRDINEAREEKQDKRIAEMTRELQQQRDRTQNAVELTNVADTTIMKVLKGIDDLVRSDCAVIYIIKQIKRYYLVK